MITYVDGYVLVVKKKDLAAYRRMAQMGGKLWRKYGALDYKECVIDDPKPKHVVLTFSKMIKQKSNETVIFSYITFKSRAHRNSVNAKVMKDPIMNDPKYKDMPMPFDMKRMAYAGFKVLVDGKKVNIPSYELKVGQTVSLDTKGMAIPVVAKLLKSKDEDIKIPAWLEKKAVVGKVAREVKREDILEPISEQDIVEFYSR